MEAVSTSAKGADGQSTSPLSRMKSTEAEYHSQQVERSTVAETARKPAKMAVPASKREVEPAMRVPDMDGKRLAMWNVAIWMPGPPNPMRKKPT